MRFDSYHPAINFLFFAFVVLMAFFFDHPAYIMTGYACAFAYSCKLRGFKALKLNLVLIPVMALFVTCYTYYTHFGITELALNIIGNSITLESLAFGISIGFRIATVIMWFSCIHVIVSSDKIIYLFGRVSPRLSLFLAVLFRFVPRIKVSAVKMNNAQQCIFRGSNQGRPSARIHNFFCVFSMVITWTAENIITVSESMQSRGYTLPGRTAFSIYRFDNRDRSLVVLMFLCFACVLMAVLFGQTRIQYDPEIIMNRITPVSVVFCAIYGFTCLVPMIVQIVSEYRFERLKQKM